MSPPILPFWFKQRQCKAEPAGDGVLKLSGPNLREAYIHVAGQPGQWTVGVRLEPEGADVLTAESDKPSSQAAWDAAFELYRQRVIV